MSEEQEILQLKGLAEAEFRAEEKKKLIDTLASYGEKAIPHILDVLEFEVRGDVRNHALNKIIEIRSRHR